MPTANNYIVVTTPSPPEGAELYNVIRTPSTVSIINKPETTPDPTIERIRALMERKGWSQNATARVLGVPYGTMGNWMQGTKAPNRVVARLLDVLGAVETLAPHVYEALLPEGEKQ